LRGRFRGRRRCGRGGVADQRQNGADRCGFVLRDTDLQEGSRDGGGDLGVDLVGGNLEEGLVHLDGFADGLQPAGDGALGDRLAQYRECYFS